MAEPLHITHVASDDGWGGAERVLSVLIPAQLQCDSLKVRAILLNDGPLAEILRQANAALEIIPERGDSVGSLLRELRRALVSTDVIHAHRYKEMALASLVRVPRQAMIATVHGLQPCRQLSLNHAAKIWAALWLARIRGCRFVAVSEELSNRIRRGLFAPGTLQIPNPFVPTVVAGTGAVDLRAHFGWRRDRRLVGFVGRLEPVKGPDLLLQAVEFLDPMIGVVFVGSGSLGNDLRTYCDEQNLASRVGFLGEVPDARPYLRQFDVLSLPSRHEGLPMVLLEAADAALPVAAFNVGGVPEVLTNPQATRRVAPQDVRGLASALMSLLEDPAAASNAREWGRAIASRFSLDDVVARYTEAYRSAVGKMLP